MRMNFPDSITIYTVAEDGYGDKTWSGATTIPAAFEQVIAKTHGDNQDAIVSTSRLYLPPDHTFLTSRGYRIEGLVVKINVLGGTDTQQFFEITDVFPVRDTLLNNDVTHVECELKKVSDKTASAIS